MKVKSGQKGFTLIEILVTLAVGAVLLSGVVTAIFQTLRITTSASPQITALEDIKNVAYWVGKDMVSANATNLVDGALPMSSLSGNWTTWYADNSTGTYKSVSHSANYTLSGGKVVRNYGVPGTADDGTTTTLTDNALTQKDDYWNGYWLKIVNTTDGLAPKGEIRKVTDFVASTDTLYTDNFTAAIGAGDTYWLYSTTIVGRYISDIQFSQAGNIITAVITSSPDISAETAENRTYQFYLQPKEGLVQ